MQERFETKKQVVLLGLVAIGLLGFSFLSHEAYALTIPPHLTTLPSHLQPLYRLYTLSGQASCQAAPVSGTWLGGGGVVGVCNVNNLVIGYWDLKVSSGIELYIGQFTNSGILDNYGSLYVGTTSNSGTINNNNSLLTQGLTNTGNINNYGTLDTGATLLAGVEVITKNPVVVSNMGKITNYHYGRITNYGILTNMGNIWNTDNVSNYGGSIDNLYSIINNGDIYSTGTITNEKSSNFTNYSLVEVWDGTFTNSGLFTNSGSFYNASPVSNTGGDITNTGTITNNAAGTILSTGTVTNSGGIGNSGTITNDGVVNNSNSIIDYCNAVWKGSGQFSGNTIVSMPCLNPLPSGANPRLHQPASGMPLRQPVPPPYLQAGQKNTNITTGNIAKLEHNYNQFVKQNVPFKPASPLINLLTLNPPSINPIKTTLSTEFFLPHTPIIIPSWIKNLSREWGIGHMDDATFLQSVQYMVQNKIIQLPNISSSTEGGNTAIPTWVKNDATYWSEGSIDDKTFTEALQYLIGHGIIKISNPLNSPLKAVANPPTFGPYFSMSVTPDQLTIPANMGGHTTTLTLTSQNSFSAGVALSFDAPQGFYVGVPESLQLLNALTGQSQVSVTEGSPTSIPLWIYAASTLQPGTYKVIITGIGSDTHTGKTTTQSATIDVNVVAPTASISTLPSGQATPLIITTPSFGDTTTNHVTISGIAPPNSEVSLDGEEFQTKSLVQQNPITGTGKTDSNNDSWSFTETLSPGWYEFTVYDSLDGIKSSSDPVEFTVQPSSSTQISPQVIVYPVIITPKVGSTVINPVTISGVGIPASTVLFTDSNGVTDSTTADANTGSWSFTETLSSGPDTISLTDFEGESFTSTMSITVESTSSSSNSSSGP